MFKFTAMKSHSCYWTLHNLIVIVASFFFLSVSCSKYRVDHTQPEHKTRLLTKKERKLTNVDKNENRHFYLFYILFFYFGDGKRITFRLLSKKSEHFQWNFRTGKHQCKENDSRARVHLIAADERCSLRYFNAHVYILSFSFVGWCWMSVYVFMRIAIRARQFRN